MKIYVIKKTVLVVAVRLSILGDLKYACSKELMDLSS